MVSYKNWHLICEFFQWSKQKFLFYWPYENPYILRFVYFLPYFWSPKTINEGGIFYKILTLCAVSIQVRFKIKSQLWWQAYS